MKRKIRLSALIAVMVLMLALLIGGLYGYFDDTETSTGNVFTAGTLNLVSVIDGTELYDNVTVNEQGDGLNDNVTFGVVIPGDSGTITWTLTNTGNVDGRLTVASTVNFDENGCLDPEDDVDLTPTGTGELGDSVTVTVEKFVDSVSQGYILLNGTLSGLEVALDGEADQDMSAGGEIRYELSWSVATTIGNEIQSDTANIGIQFTLEQYNAP